MLLAFLLLPLASAHLHHLSASDLVNGHFKLKVTSLSDPN
jgi:hypothetical protein